MVEESKVTDKQLDYFVKTTVEQEKIKTKIRDFLGGRTDFEAAWKKATRDQKVQVYELWEEAENKEQFNDNIDQRIQDLRDKRAGRAQMETVAGGSDKESQKSGMSKFDKDQIQTAVDKMSSQGKKIMQYDPETEQINTEKVVENVEMLPKQDLKILAKQLGVQESKVVDAVQNMSKEFKQQPGDLFGHLDEAIQNLSKSSKSKISIAGDIQNQEQAEKLLQQIDILPQKEQLQIRKAYNDDIIEQRLKLLSKSHPKSMAYILEKFSDVHVPKYLKSQAAMFPADFNKIDPIPSGWFMDSNWFKINKRREKIYDRIKSFEQQQLPTMTEHNKLLYKEATRNGGQNGADLAVIENYHGIEDYRVKYPSLDQMLDLKIVDQYAFDLAQKRHLTFVQTNLLTDILKSGGSVVIPNLEFLRQEYVQKQQRGQDYSKEFKKYQEAITKQVGQQVSYVGEQNWKFDVAKPTKNLGVPALQNPLQKPNMIPVKDVMIGIEQMVDYISKLSGNLNQLQLKNYKQVEDVFSSSVVQKKEPTTFKPQPGMAFKLRELMC